MKFSVLMSIYYKERPEYFDRAMVSIWDEQKRKPDEVVLVIDGKLPDELYAIIHKWKNKLGDILKIVPLEKNVGLGGALNEGLKHCSYELIARMDSDDISLPDRFEKQLRIFRDYDIDVCGGWVAEFDKNEKQVISYRKVPEHHYEIVKFAKRRSPINHPTVMFKKSAVEKIGGYRKIRFVEDYDLWVRLIVNGAKFYNIQEVLVYMSAGDYMIEKRRGLKYAITEIKLQKEFLRMGFINHFEFLTNISTRATARIMPKSLLKIIYNVFRR